MKKFLIEFFRPIDTLIFNYLVRLGLIKPFFGFLASALLGGVAASKLHKKKAKAAQAAAVAKAASTISKGKKDVPGTGAEKVANAINIINKAKKGTIGGAALGGMSKVIGQVGAKAMKAKVFPSLGPLMRSSSAVQSGLKRAAGPLRSPAGGGSGSAVSPAGYGMNFARRERKRKLRAALGYGSRIF